MNNTFKIKMLSIVLDCENAHELADFYAALLGWTKRDDNPEWIGVRNNKIITYTNLFRKMA